MIAAPCGCADYAGPLTQLQCLAARQEGERRIQMLDWVLESTSDLEPWVERMAKAARTQ